MSARAPLLVGLVLVAAASSLSYFVVTTSKDKYDGDATYVVYADFDDASGIRWKTRVQINGIDIGKIEQIKHVRTEQGQLVARVSIRLLDDYVLYENAMLRKAAESLLGDFRLDLDPGTPDAPRIEPGGLIRQVRSESDLDAIQKQLLNVADNVNNVTESFSRVLSGPAGEGSLKAILSRVETSMEAIEQTTQLLAGVVSKNDSRINETIANLTRFSRALADATATGGDAARVAQNVAKLTERLDRVLEAVHTMVAGDETGVDEQASVRETLEDLNQSMAHLTAITRKVNEGEGTLGRVVNDAGIADKVEQTLDDTSELIGSLSRLQTKIELRTEYGVPFGKDNELVQAAIKNTLGLWIVPKPDKYYILEAIADPRGRQVRTVKSSVRWAEGDATCTEATPCETTEEQTVVSFDDLKFSAQFAKRYYFLTLRFGIIENTGGIGLNLHGLGDKLELRFDAYDFDRRDPVRDRSIFPRLRTIAMYEIISHISLQAGFDDPLNPRLRTWFAGGILRFTDDDLKALLTVAPSPM